MVLPYQVSNWYSDCHTASGATVVVDETVLIRVTVSQRFCRSTLHLIDIMSHVDSTAQRANSTH